MSHQYIQVPHAAHQMVDVDVDADIGILLQVADMGVVAIGRAIDQAQLALAQKGGRVADVGIFGHAALETAGYAELSDWITRRDGVFNVLVTHHGSRGLGADIYKRGQVAARKWCDENAKDIPDAVRLSFFIDRQNGSLHFKELAAAADSRKIPRPQSSGDLDDPNFLNGNGEPGR